MSSSSSSSSGSTAATATAATTATAAAATAGGVCVVLDKATPDTVWRERLDAKQFQVTRQCGTERAFSSPLYFNKKPGNYRCICCGTLLFT